jgi:lipooligosaccharide transport system permease protein
VPTLTRRASANPVVAVAVLCFGGLTAALTQTMVIPIQTELPQLLHTSAANATWVITITLLTAAISMPVAGRLADLFGKQRVLVGSATILLVSSVICALSSSLAPMLVGRAMQGLALGFIPVGISLIREITPPHMASTAIATMSATLGVGGAIGLPLSAWIVQAGSWHVLFWVASVMAALVLALVWAAVPHVHDAQPGRLDLVGILGLAVGLAALISAPIDDGGVEVSYLVFVAPALLMTSTIAVASEEFTYPVMAGFKWRRYFFGFSASPIAGRQIALGVVLGASARMVVVAVAYTAFLYIFGAVPAFSFGWTMIFVSLLAGLSFGVPLMAYAASIYDDKGQFALVQRFVFMPMFLFSGTFYPLAALPLWLQWIGWISPLWHATELGRWISYGAEMSPVVIVLHFGYLIALVVAGYLFAIRFFETRLAK